MQARLVEIQAKKYTEQKMERMQEPVRVPSQSNQARSIPVALTPQHHHKLVDHVRELKSLVDSHLSEQAFNSVEAGAHTSALPIGMHG